MTEKLRCRWGWHFWISVTLHWQDGGPAYEDHQCRDCGILRWEHDVGRPHRQKIARITTNDINAIGFRRSPPIHHEPAAFEP